MPTHLDFIGAVTASDANALHEKEKHYGSSWKKRGGVGAFMMLARKWDRLETALAPHPRHPELANGASQAAPVAPWDILRALAMDQREEGILDDIRDLRRYLVLVEAEHMARQAVPAWTGRVGGDRSQLDDEREAAKREPFGYDGEG